MLSGSSYGILYHGNKCFYVYIEWTGVQDITKNQTTVAVNFFISGDDVDYSYRDCTLEINGEKYEFQIDSSLAFKISSIPKTLIKSVTTVISHDNDGSKKLEINGIWNHNSWNLDVTAKVNATLDQIDRNAPEISVSTVSNIGMSSFSFQATANATCDNWSYSLDGGNSWIEVSGKTTTINVDVTGLSKDTVYKLRVKGRRVYNEVYGTSDTVTVKTTGSTILNSATFGNADDDIVEGTLNLTVLDVHFHKLVFSYSGKELFTTDGFAATSGNNTIVLTENERKKILYAIKNKVSGLFSVTIKTYTDEACTNQLNTVSSIMVTLKTTAKSKPVFSGFTYEDSVQAVVDVTGNNQVLVHDYSNLLVHCVAATPLNEATIVSYEATISENYVKNSSTELNVGSIAEDGEFTLSVTCTDSRGYKTTVKKTVRVITYADPNISTVELRRKNGIDRLIELSFSGIFSKIDADGVNDTNRLTEVKYRYKERKEEEYGEFVSLLDRLSINGNYFSFESYELEEFEIEKTYDFQIVVKDRLGNLSFFEINLVLNKLTPSVAIRNANSQYPFTRVGINNNSPQYPLDVGGAIAMNSSVVLGYCGTLKDGETVRSKLKGGIYLYDASYEASDAPEKVPAIIEAVCAGNFSIIRFITLDENCSIYVTSFSGSSWSLWKKL